MKLGPCRCGHPGAGCTCFEERRAEVERAEAVDMAPEPVEGARVTIELPLEEFRFITEYDPDRERSASRADLVIVLAEIGGLLRAYRV